MRIGVRADFSEPLQLALEMNQRACDAAELEKLINRKNNLKRWHRILEEPEKNDDFKINRGNNLIFWYCQRESRSFQFINFSYNLKAG